MKTDLQPKLSLEFPPLPAGAASTGSSSSNAAANTGSSSSNAATSEISAGQDISQVPDDPRTSVSDISGKAKSQYTRPQQQQAQQEAAEDQDRITSSFTDDPIKWFQMYKYWNWNLAKDDPRGRFNERSFQNTMNMSRLADAYNNRLWQRAGTVGRTTAMYGSTDSHTNAPVQYNVQTEEMRQRDADRAVDSAARQSDIRRQASLLDYPLELQRSADQAKQSLAKYQAQTGIDLERFIQKGIFDSEYTQSWNTYWQNLVYKFTQELGLNINERLYKKIINLNYPFSQIYAYLQKGINVPNQLQMYAYQWINEMLNDPSLTPADRMQLSTTMYGLVAGMVARQGLGSFGQGIMGNAPATGPQ